MKFKKEFLIAELFLMAIFFFGFVSSAPPVTQVQQFTDGYVIEIPQDNVLKLGDDYYFEFHVFNISNGFPITSGVSFNLHIYDESGKHIYSGYSNSPSFEDYDYFFNVSGNNFTKATTYYYHAQCNNSHLGGYSSSTIIVTETGINSENFDVYNLWGLFGIAVLFFAIGLTFDKTKFKLRMFFFICSLMMGLLFLNSIKIVLGSADELITMGIIAFILAIFVLSFMFLYLLINYTIEVFHYFKERGRMRWSVGEA